jgi:methyl-accepting chemotaxis protein
MFELKTFRSKIAAALAAIAAIAALMGGVGILSLKAVIAAKDRVISVNAQNLVSAQRLRAAVEGKGSGIRGFLFSPEDKYLSEVRGCREEIAAGISLLRGMVFTEEGRRLVKEIERANEEHDQAVDKLVEMRKAGASGDSLLKFFKGPNLARRAELDRKIEAFADLEQKLLDRGNAAAAGRSASAVWFMALLTLAGGLAAFALAAALSRRLSRQIASAVGQVQSSSAELQASTSQQASNVKEQSSSIAEIATTINELLATSRQIAESAQRVAHIASETAKTAGAGDQALIKTQGSIAVIRQQVDLIVSHMMDLGRKSQQIGAVLEIINELAEQTNILSINASVEAAGAGEAGRRFAVVAEEIRRLAERVGASTKDVRSLIDEVRAAVNTTVMATEGGAKAVEAGSRQFSETSASFQQISGMVATSTEAAREIELSTKQQATAVEQVNGTVAQVAQSVREMEAGLGQTAQTALQLSALSRELALLIKPKAD